MGADRAVAGLVDFRSVRAADTLGPLLAVHVVAAGVQDRDGTRRPLPRARLDRPTVEKVWTDQDFAGRLVARAEEILERTVEIVRKPSDRRGFQVRPEQWVVERIFSSPGSPHDAVWLGATSATRRTPSPWSVGR